MSVHVVAMGVRMRVDSRICLRPRVQKAGDVPHTEGDEHESDAQFHRQTEARRNNEVKQNDGHTHSKDRERVSYSPNSANQCGTPGTLLAAHDRTHSNHMIGVGSVAHTEKKTHCDNGEYADHSALRDPITRMS